jgi:DNA polymerase V
MPEEKEQLEGVSVHSGFPNPATDKRLQTLDFNQLLVRHAVSTFMFRVEGNDWQDVGVFAGDIAIVDRALDPRKSDVIIWWNEPKGEFAISNYPDMPKEASCWGVVTATIHQFRGITRE